MNLKMFYLRESFLFGKQIIIYITKNREKCNVIGIAISTKTCHAVKRNHIKRLIRENYQKIKNRLYTGYNIVFLWNKRETVENADFHVIERDMNFLLDKAGLIKIKDS